MNTNRERVVVVTGGASGMGLGICRRFAEAGHPVAMLDVQEALLERESAALAASGARVLACKVDVASREQIDAAYAAVRQQLGPIAIAIANAGISKSQDFLTMSTPAWQRMLDVNLTGVFHTVEVSRQALIDRGGGAIVITSSTAGINGIGGGGPGGLGYTASKHGVVGLMRSYANVLAPHNIRVNTVHPTGVNTPMIVNDVMAEFLATMPDVGQALTNALPVDMLEPADISNAILWLVSDDARYVTGVTLPVDAGFTVKK